MGGGQDERDGWAEGGESEYESEFEYEFELDCLPAG
jgi:hypothetical protein